MKGIETAVEKNLKIPWASSAACRNPKHLKLKFEAFCELSEELKNQLPAA
jgi:hypothetical protein